VRATRAEDVRVAPDELLVDLARDVVEIEIPAFGRELGVKHHLDQHVPEFLAHVRDVVPVDGFEQFAALVDQAAGERLVRLLAIPRASVGRPQPRHRLAEFFNRRHAEELPRNTRNTRKIRANWFGFRVFRVFRGFPSSWTSSLKSWPTSAG